MSLSQQPANITCAYAPSPSATNVSPAGGTFFFDVLTGVGCPTVSASLGANSSHIQIVSNSGGRVSFSVGSHNGTADRTGSIVVAGQTHTVRQFGVAPPSNDALAQAQTLSSTPKGSVEGRNTNATAEANEPSHAGSAAARSVWYRWTAPSSGLFSFTTSGSTFDTVLAVYTGTSVSGLTRIAENDDTTGFDQTSKINFRASAGVVYYIAVDGKNGASGSLRLSYSPFRRLFRLYLQNFNGFASPIIPASVTARRQDNTGATIPGEFISLGVYEFDLPDDNSPYEVTIAGPEGITWSPSTYLIDNTAGRFNELMGGAPGGGQNQTSNATNTIPKVFKGFIHGISSGTDLAVLQVRIATPGSSSAQAPRNCGEQNNPGNPPPVLVGGGPNGAMRVLYSCVTQPNTVHNIIPAAPNKAFQAAVLDLREPLAQDTGPATANAITAVNAPTYNIGGRVLAGGQPLDGAVIDISSGAMSARATSINGSYEFANLAPGQSYTLRASRSGFIFESQTVILQAPGASSVDFAAQSCNYALTGGGNFIAGGGQGEFDVVASNAACEWTARNDSDWMTINSGSSVGGGKVQFAVQPNTGAARQGAIIVGEQIFTVTQATGCSFGVSFSGAANIAATGGTGSLTVTTSNGNCVWTAASNDYCMINVGGSVSGGGTINYTVSSNPGVARSVVITAAGQTFTVNQAAAAGTHRTKFDYDGDGKADIAVYRPTAGAWYLLRSRDGFLGIGLGQADDKPAAADYDGDGKTDVAVYRPSDGTWYILKSSDGQVSVVRFGAAEDIPVPADYDGDEKADIAVYRPSKGEWYRLNSTTGEFHGVAFGAAEDKPVPADYDGDGKADIAVYRPSAGAWYRLNSATGEFHGIAFGAVEDKPVPADYDGDEKADIAVYRPSTGAWYRLNSLTGEFLGIAFGAAEDVPAAADYNGDKSADIAVYRPSRGEWYIWSCTNNERFRAERFGASTDKIPQALNVP